MQVKVKLYTNTIGYNFIPQIPGNFPRNYSGKVPLFFQKNSAGNLGTELPTLVMARLAHLIPIHIRYNPDAFIGYTSCLEM